MQRPVATGLARSFCRGFSKMRLTCEEETKQLWKTADAVCFDVDSTVVTGEAIDELATFCDRGQEVSEWTVKAMGGGVPFRQALDERLKIIHPTLKQLESFIQASKLKLTPHIRDVVTALHNKGTGVYLVSGGFRRILEPIADDLGISRDNIFANRILFDDKGNYSGFDREALTSESGGKGRAVALLKNTYHYKKLVMVGDGATDMEACPPADAFIGFGGNVIREKVKENSPWFVTDFQTLLDHLHGP